MAPGREALPNARAADAPEPSHRSRTQRAWRTPAPEVSRHAIAPLRWKSRPGAAQVQSMSRCIIVKTGLRIAPRPSPVTGIDDDASAQRRLTSPLPVPAFVPRASNGVCVARACILTPMLAGFYLFSDDTRRLRQKSSYRDFTKPPSFARDLHGPFAARGNTSLPVLRS